MDSMYAALEIFNLNYTLLWPQEGKKTIKLIQLSKNCTITMARCTCFNNCSYYAAVFAWMKGCGTCPEPIPHLMTNRCETS